VQTGEFTDRDFVQALAGSGARVLIIGRRALILLGAPVLTADYDPWVHFDDIEKLNAAFARLDHEPNRPPGEASHTGRYVLDLITTKRWASRPRDIVDIQYLEQLRRRGDA
jgi:hypothetical protein